MRLVTLVLHHELVERTEIGLRRRYERIRVGAARGHRTAIVRQAHRYLRLRIGTLGQTPASVAAVDDVARERPPFPRVDRFGAASPSSVSVASAEAAAVVRDFLGRELQYPQRLRWTILSAADDLLRK